jgi:hypothetical protein
MMDEGRFSISADDLDQRLGSAAAPIVIDARRASVRGRRPRQRPQKQRPLLPGSERGTDPARRLRLKRAGGCRYSSELIEEARWPR